jgi:hypothetical protein
MRVDDAGLQRASVHSRSLMGLAGFRKAVQLMSLYLPTALRSLVERARDKPVRKTTDKPVIEVSSLLQRKTV